MEILLGDCLEKLRYLENCSVDSLITDPPAGISFMGKEWDSDKGGRKNWIEWMTTVMRECLRVMKPGAHGLVWAIPRTSHWTATALEDAGFEVRDVITHLFGQGFPKSLDISKAIDKAAGAAREVVGTKERPGGFNRGQLANTNFGRAHQDDSGAITAPCTDAAKQWSGWGTALKPASEHWILVRKPCAEKTVAANVLEWGTGGINIDGCRIGTESTHRPLGRKMNGQFNGRSEENKSLGIIGGSNSGRFPANLVLSHSQYCTDNQCDIECAIDALDNQSGPCKTGGASVKTDCGKSIFGKRAIDKKMNTDKGSGASRFFYCAKVSSSERNAGLEDMPDREGGIKNSSGRGYSERDPNKTIIVKNNHPTVKPQKLMRYLCKLITPPNGIILDPFMGSGSTGIAAKSEGFDFVGIEKNNDYFLIAEERLKNI